MPKYVYQGLETGEVFEVEQRISEAALTRNPKNNEPVKRLIGRPAISFRGNGFYANDSKGSKSADTSTEKPSICPETQSSCESCCCKT